MGMPMQPRSMVEMNSLFMHHFRRVHGRDSALDLPRWAAVQVRYVIALQDPADPMRATSKWTLLTRRQQQDRLLAHLGRMPDAIPDHNKGLEWLKIPTLSIR